ncbi:MAG: glucosaminidase domain-containing protein [Acidimicrobiia bacterium]
MTSRSLLACVLLAVVTATALPGAPAGAVDATPDPASRIASLQATASAADAEATQAAAERDAITADLTSARERQVNAEARLTDLDAAAVQARADAEVARERVARVVVDAYVDGGSRTDVISGFLDASNVSELRRNQELTDRVGNRQQDVLKAFRQARVVAQRAADAARTARDEIGREVTRLEEVLPAVTLAATESEQLAETARFQLDRWTSVRGGPDTPIMGAARLTGTDLARWFRSQRREARTTMPIEELADTYIAEGDAAGVRGDIAFAQSVLETGSFFFPDRGQVRPADNNFAGIGACDSCSTGRGYPDARTGVRAQIQLLRAYADASVTADNLGNPPVDPKLPSFFLKGRAPTWSGLTGTWATSTTYAPKIFELYFRILAWVTDHPDPRTTGADGRE